ncbi:MAG: hypothetical protein IT167_32175 [Bryobacterales bacterium]|nr:hypothetical protein [Bryobacterales bacterium]
MAKVLAIMKSSPAACAFVMAFGIGAMLSVAYVEPDDTMRIHLRQVVGGVCLLFPGIAQRIADGE